MQFYSPKTLEAATSASFQEVTRHRVMDVLALPATPTDATGDGQRLPSLRGDVEFRSVHFAYDGRPDVAVLRGLSLRVPAGSSVALVGASGSGKTTAVALLLRLYEPTTGAATPATPMNGVVPASGKDGNPRTCRCTALCCGQQHVTSCQLQGLYRVPQ